jgi:hypothetical protein
VQVEVLIDLVRLARSQELEELGLEDLEGHVDQHVSCQDLVLHVATTQNQLLQVSKLLHLEDFILVLWLLERLCLCHFATKVIQLVLDQRQE